MKTAQHCSGCRDDRYNHRGLCERPGIDAPVTCSQCWHLQSAKMVTLYALSTSAPMNCKGAYRKLRLPHCYHQDGTVYLSKQQFLEHTR